MGADIRYEAFVLHRGDKKAYKDRDAWRSVTVKTMDAERAQHLQKLVQKKKTDAESALGKLKCGDARRQIERLLDTRNQAEGGMSSYRWGIVFLEAHRTPKWGNKSIWRDEKVEFTSTIDVLIARELKGAAPFGPFAVPTGAGNSFQSNLDTPLPFMGTSQAGPSTPPNKKKTKKGTRKGKGKKEDSDSDDSHTEIEDDYGFSDSDSSEDTPLTRSTSSGKKIGRGRSHDRKGKGHANSRHGSPGGKKHGKPHDKPVVHQDKGLAKRMDKLEKAEKDRNAREERDAQAKRDQKLDDLIDLLKGKGRGGRGGDRRGSGGYN